MRRARSTRGGVALAGATALLALALLTAGSTSLYRRGATRRVATLARRAAARAVATAALAEVANPARLRVALATPEAQEALARAIQGGTLAQGVLTPAPAAIALRAEVAEDSAREHGLELAPVEVALAGYLPLANLGSLRITVEVRGAGLLAGELRRETAEIDVTFTEDAGVLLPRVAPGPRARILG